MNRRVTQTAVRVASTVVAAVLLATALVHVPSASAAGVPLGGGEARIALASGFVKALRQEGVVVKALRPAALRGRKLTLPVSSGSYDPAAGRVTVAYAGGFKLVAGGKAVALRKLRLDVPTGSLSAVIAGKRMRLADLATARLRPEGFDARMSVERMRMSIAAAAVFNRDFELPQVFRAGRSIGSLDGLAEPSEVEAALGQMCVGGPGTTFSRLESLKVSMGLWGATERWGQQGTENCFIFPLKPARVATDASAGVLEGGENDGITMQIEEGPPREMLLRHPRVDLAAREISATISPLSTEGALTGTIATLDYSAAQFQFRAKVGAFELMHVHAISNQFIADQLNARFATPGMFQAGETLAQLTVLLSA